jgi:hypothetical protein
MLSGDPLGRARAVVEVMRRPGREGRKATLALAGGLGLEPVLAEGGEVDHQVGPVEDAFLDCSDLLCHGREATGGPGRKTPRFAGDLAGGDQMPGAGSRIRARAATARPISAVPTTVGSANNVTVTAAESPSRLPIVWKEVAVTTPI